MAKRGAYYDRFTLVLLGAVFLCGMAGISFLQSTVNNYELTFERILGDQGWLITKATFILVAVAALGLALIFRDPTRSRGALAAIATAGLMIAVCGATTLGPINETARICDPSIEAPGLLFGCTASYPLSTDWWWIWAAIIGGAILFTAAAGRLIGDTLRPSRVSLPGKPSPTH